jgi:hypothetical protein
MAFIGEPLDLLSKHVPGSEEDFEFAELWTGLTEPLPGWGETERLIVSSLVKGA